MGEDLSEDSLDSPLIDNLHDKHSFTHVLDDLIEGRRVSPSIDTSKHNKVIINELSDKVPARDDHQSTLSEGFEEKDDLDYYLEDSLDGSDTFDEIKPLMGKLQDILDPLIGSFQEVSENVEKSPKKESPKEDIKSEVEVDPLAQALEGIFESSGNLCLLEPKVEVKNENPVKQDCMWGDKDRISRKKRQRQRKFSFTISQIMDTKGSMPDICNPTSSALLSTSSRNFSIPIPDDFYLESPFDSPKEETNEISSDVDMDDEEDYLSKVRKSLPGENSVIVVRKNKMSTKIEVESSDESPHMDHSYCLPHKEQQKSSTSYGLLTPPPSEPEEEDGELSRQSYQGGFEVALKNLQQHQIPEQTITGSHVGLPSVIKNEPNTRTSIETIEKATAAHRAAASKLVVPNSKEHLALSSVPEFSPRPESSASGSMDSAE